MYLIAQSIIDKILRSFIVYIFVYYVYVILCADRLVLDIVILIWPQIQFAEFHSSPIRWYVLSMFLLSMGARCTAVIYLDF